MWVGVLAIGDGDGAWVGGFGEGALIVTRDKEGEQIGGFEEGVYTSSDGVGD